jgi:hypothetical protein
VPFGARGLRHLIDDQPARHRRFGRRRVRIYDRALTASEIQALFGLGQ